MAGAFKANRIISDAEAREVIDDWNAKHPNEKVEYDWQRESGKEYNAETMKLEETEWSKRRTLGEREVENTLINSSENKYPKTRPEAVALIPEGGKLCHNSDQNVDVRVGRKSIRHSSLHDEEHVYMAFGKIDEIIEKAIKIGEEPVDKDEEGHTLSVNIFYAPVNVDGVQYSARMVIKEYENKGTVLDEFSLYNVSMHKEKAPSHTNLSASVRSGAQYDSAISGYKIKDLIHSTQENDKKILGLGEDFSPIFFCTSDGEAYGLAYQNLVLQTPPAPSKLEGEISFPKGGQSLT